MGEGKEYITHPDDKGSINISEDVVAIISAAAVAEVDGVASLSTSIGKDIAELLGKRNVPKGIKITFAEDSVTVDAHVMVSYGYSITGVAKEVQNAVISAVEAMTALSVSAVNVHICGISFGKD